MKNLSVVFTVLLVGCTTTQHSDESPAKMYTIQRGGINLGAYHPREPLTATVKVDGSIEIK